VSALADPTRRPPDPLGQSGRAAELRAYVERMWTDALQDFATTGRLFTLFRDVADAG
jgi:hypothetical protein